MSCAYIADGDALTVTVDAELQSEVLIEAVDISTMCLMSADGLDRLRHPTRHAKHIVANIRAAAGAS
jgi:hypothetical protein